MVNHLLPRRFACVCFVVLAGHDAALDPRSVLADSQRKVSERLGSRVACRALTGGCYFCCGLWCSTFSRFVQTFTILLKQRLPRLYSLMETLGINPEALFASW